jgi:hypothetical protein
MAGLMMALFGVLAEMEEADGLSQSFIMVSSSPTFAVPAATAPTAPPPPPPPPPAAAFSMIIIADEEDSDSDGKELTTVKVEAVDNVVVNFDVVVVVSVSMVKVGVLSGDKGKLCCC